ncbi:hypothetical protein EN808_30825 [Mesorhizobium sp. M8A.F.Ca.ET.165.01.1.1]|nr:hypothetical protein EN808_30825 [Mesorhizobium sp. M8A.F.Ca.ET.165.01.1.1]TIS47372.1 MAG: hypothetical protein E5W96_22585 [Mesorhizobium sp.]
MVQGRLMRGRGLIRALRQDDARQVRARIAELERDLMTTTPLGRHQRFEAGHELRRAKFAWRSSKKCIGQIPESSGR